MQEMLGLVGVEKVDLNPMLIREVRWHIVENLAIIFHSSQDKERYNEIRKFSRKHVRSLLIATGLPFSFDIW